MLRGRHVWSGHGYRSRLRLPSVGELFITNGQAGGERHALELHRGTFDLGRGYWDFEGQRPRHGSHGQGIDGGD